MECLKKTLNCPIETLTYYVKDLNRFVNYCKQYGLIYKINNSIFE